MAVVLIRSPLLLSSLFCHRFPTFPLIYKVAITSKIKHAIKHKTSPAILAQLLQPSLAFCFSLQPMTAYRPRQQLCNSYASLAGLVLCFIACFILAVIAP